jgi:hypothetical protein
MPPEEAVIVKVPFAPAAPVEVTTPAETVAMVVLLEVQVATLVMGNGPLQVVAVAVNEVDGIVFVMTPLDGDIVIDVMQPTVTVSD